ncbi:hypothetical protein ElyMa_003411800 [Elysia marginata]|uniref:Uncharacterized protein n=1 Tax=Elysia marginata TaxID=1093978 RepID=A0AAV4JUS5_9GAST|nr:hypothetical protein ElyMa_003411800 [Elysia marginata]
MFYFFRSFSRRAEVSVASLVCFVQLVYQTQVDNNPPLAPAATSQSKQSVSQERLEQFPSDTSSGCDSTDKVPSQAQQKPSVTHQTKEFSTASIPPLDGETHSSATKLQTFPMLNGDESRLNGGEAKDIGDSAPNHSLCDNSSWSENTTAEEQSDTEKSYVTVIPKADIAKLSNSGNQCVTSKNQTSPSIRTKNSAIKTLNNHNPDKTESEIRVRPGESSNLFSRQGNSDACRNQAEPREATLIREAAQESKTEESDTTKRAETVCFECFKKVTFENLAAVKQAEKTVEDLTNPNNKLVHRSDFEPTDVTVHLEDLFF